MQLYNPATQSSKQPAASASKQQHAAHRGPLPSSRMSLATFMRLTATVLSAPEASTTASCAASASNLLGAVTKGMPVSLATCGGRDVCE